MNAQQKFIEKLLAQGFYFVKQISAQENIFLSRYQAKIILFSNNSLHIAMNFQHASTGDNHYKNEMQHLQHNVKVSPF